MVGPKVSQAMASLVHLRTRVSAGRHAGRLAWCGAYCNKREEDAEGNREGTHFPFVTDREKGRTRNERREQLPFISRESRVVPE